MYIIYCDGSAKKNGSKDSPGGFGVVVTLYTGYEKDEEATDIVEVHQEHTEGTTNNREEMKAILWAMEKYGKEFPVTTVYSDSIYCVRSFTEWLDGWKKNGWTRAGGKKLENLDLIQKYDRLVLEGYKIDLKHIKGHAGHKYNEMADGLATGQLKESDLPVSKATSWKDLIVEEGVEQVSLEGF